ncbi:MAG: helix-turn-helix domain-containing protein [Bacteroidaceae bacterium]|nr:helix-turn-helix domain-containing protein [Bacteroidaceae bacterium]
MIMEDFQKVLMQIAEPLINVIVDRVAVKVKQLEKEKEPRFYSRKEAAKLLHVSLPTLNEYTKQGRLKSRRINGRVLYDANEIDNAAENFHKGMHLKR